MSNNFSNKWTRIFKFQNLLRLITNLNSKKPRAKFHFRISNTNNSRFRKSNVSLCINLQGKLIFKIMSKTAKIKNEIANDIFEFRNFQFLRKIIQTQSSIPQSREIFTAVPEVIRWSYLANKSRYKICKNQTYSLIINEIH